MQKGKFIIYSGTINHEDYPVLGATVVIAVTLFIAIGLTMLVKYW